MCGQSVIGRISQRSRLLLFEICALIASATIFAISYFSSRGALIVVQSEKLEALREARKKQLLGYSYPLKKNSSPQPPILLPWTRCGRMTPVGRLSAWVRRKSCNGFTAPKIQTRPVRK